MNSSSSDFQHDDGQKFLNRLLGDFHPSSLHQTKEVPLLSSGPEAPMLGHLATGDNSILCGPGGSDLSDQSIIVSDPIPLLKIDCLQILQEFIAHCLPSTTSGHEVPLRWLDSVTFVSHEPRALELAVLALGLGWAGHVDDHTNCIESGLENYVAAVGELRKDISQASPEQIVLTISLLTLYELYEFGSEFSRGWITHLDGMKKIFITLGPASVAKGPLIELFSFYRILEVSAHFVCIR